MNDIQFFSTARPKKETFHYYFNAFKTWHKLRLDVTLLSCPDREFQGLLARYGIKWQPEPELDQQFGLPRFDRLFRHFRELCQAEYMCYLNSDNMLSPQFMANFAFLRQHFAEFFMVGRRWDWYQSCPIDEGDDFENLFSLASKRGNYHEATGVDYFVYPARLLDDLEIPPFIFPMGKHDHWLTGLAWQAKIPLVDTTQTNLVIQPEPGELARGTHLPETPGYQLNSQLFWQYRGGCDISGASHQTYREANGDFQIKQIRKKPKKILPYSDWKGLVKHCLFR